MVAKEKAAGDAQKSKISRLPLINSSIAFALAGMFALTLHECSHMVTQLLLGNNGALYQNFVTDGNASPYHHAIVAGVGPLFSIVSGLIVILASLRFGKGFWALAVKWFGFLSAQIGFGYFVIAPFESSGDTGQVLAYWHAGWVLKLIVCAIGVAGFAWLLSKLFERSFSPHAIDKRSFFQLGMWPWLIGTGILFVIYNIALSSLSARSHIDGFTSAVSAIIIIGVCTIGVFTPIANFDEKSAKVRPAELKLAMPVAGIILLAIFAIWLIIWPANGYVFG